MDLALTLLAAPPPAWLAAGAAALFGLIIGSFLNVVIHRVPLMMLAADAAVPTAGNPLESAPTGRFDLAWPPSRCPACGRPTRWIENIPLISFIALRGRCAGCRAAIGWRVPAIELAGAAIPLLFFGVHGPTPFAVAGILFCWWGLTLAMIDLDTFLLPDLLVLPLLWLGLVIAALAGGVGGVPRAADAIWGTVAGYLGFRAVHHLGARWVGRPVLGFGDVKLLAAIGAWLGPFALPVALFIGSFAGSVIGLTLIALRRHRRGDPLPFGPFLILGAAAALMCGPDAETAYEMISRQS